MADENDDSLPYLPDAAPPVSQAEPGAPSLPPVGQSAPRPPASGVADPADHEPPLADRLATRNVPTARPAIDYGLPTQPVERPTAPEAYVRPELESMGPSTAALLIGRGLMVIAMLLIGLAARRASGPAASERGEAFWPVVASAGVFVLVAVAGLVYWSVALAGNAQRLKARAAGRRSMGWSWVPVLAWVVVSSLTYLRVELDAELDPLPGVAGIGFAVLLAIPYARLQGIFRALSRRPPVVWIGAFPLDLLGFGLVWWRLTSWPDPVTSGDADHVQLTSYIAFGAAAAMAVNLIVFVVLAQRGGSAVYERLGRLEMRHRSDEPTSPTLSSFRQARREPESA